jgi:hypothetical protein
VGINKSITVAHKVSRQIGLQSIGFIKKKQENGERRVKPSTCRFPPLRISEPLWISKVAVIVRGTGVYFKGARLFEEANDGSCITDLNGFGLLSKISYDVCHI